MNNPEVEHLAYWLWQQRGMPFGSPDEDWFRAEALLKRQDDRFETSLHEMPLSSVGRENGRDDDIRCGRIHDALYATQF